MKYKQTLGLFIVSLVLCITIRTLELIYIVDGTTGFLKEEFRGIGICAVIVILAAVAAVTAVAAAVFRTPKKAEEINLSLSLSSVAMSVLTIYSLAFLPSSSQSLPFQRALMMFFGVLFTIFFLVYSFKSIKNFKLFSAAYIIPVAFWIVKLMNNFAEISAISLITENVFNILSGCAVTIFMLEFSKFECCEKKKYTFRLLSSGIAATMLCAIASVPPLCAAVVLGPQHIHENSANIFSLLFTAIFIGTFIFTHFKDKQEVRYKHSL